MTYEEKDAAKRKAYHELTDTLSHVQMQLLNVILDASDVCPTCCNTYPDNIAMDEPMHPRYVAGYKAGHKAGRKWGPLPEKKEETPRVVEHHVFQAHCKCCNTLYEYQGKDIQTIELGSSRITRRSRKGIRCTQCQTFIEHVPVPYYQKVSPPSGRVLFDGYWVRPETETPSPSRSADLPNPPTHKGFVD